MDYFKIYENIINISKNRNISLDEYYENHHIIPKSIFETEYCKIIFYKYYHNINDKDDKNNITQLTLREHYICHLLIVRIFENNENCYIRMLYAANFLTNRIKNNREYDWQRKDFYLYLKKSMTGKPSKAKGKKWSEESKKNKSGINHVMYNKTYDELYGLEKANELKQKRSESSKGRIMSNEQKIKLSNRIITDETKNKISNSKKGKKLPDETIRKIKIFMSNYDLNPSVDQTIYKFYHKDGRIIFSRKIEMKKNYKCTNIHKIIDGTRNVCKGWIYMGENSHNDYKKPIK